MNYDEAEHKSPGTEVNLARLRQRIVSLNESLLVSLDSLKGERVTPANRPGIRIACKLYLAMEECMLAIDDLIEHKVEECEDGHDMSERPGGENGERECRREREAVETDKPADNLLGRLKQEYRNLDEKTDRMFRFLLFRCGEVDARSWDLQRHQLLAMEEYKRILEMRITYMGEEKCEDGHDMSERPGGENGERECQRKIEAVETDKPTDNLLGRLKQEYRNLDEKMGRLHRFILLNRERLDARSRELLECQMLAMKEYKRVLGMRITYMGEERCEDGHDMSEKPDGENKEENNKK